MKTIAVIVRTTDVERGAEALRAAVGLTLRGDRVRVVLPPGASAEGRAVATLVLLGHQVTRGDAAIAAALAGADAVEVWT